MIMPFGIDPKPVALIYAMEDTREAQAELPPTICKHRACCCKAGCPNMYCSEYMSLRESFVDRLDQEERLELLILCTTIAW